GALGGELLHHQRQLVHARTAAAVLLGNVHAEEAERACLFPQFGQRLALARLGQHVVAVGVLDGELGDRGAQGLAFVGLDETHGLPYFSSIASSGSTAASTSPSST